MSRGSPISLLPAVSKLIEKVVRDQFTEHLESNDILNPRQYGFRKERSIKLYSGPVCE